MTRTLLCRRATNVDSRALELDNIETWDKANNLALTRFKIVDIVITDGKRKRPASQPPPLPDISRTSNHQDTRHCYLEQIVCQRPCHQSHQQVFSDTVYTDNTMCSWIV